MALIAVVDEGARPVIAGEARYVVVEPGQAEIAFAVTDKYQGQGVGAALMRNLTAVARKAGLRELTAHVLPENVPMLRLLKNSGLRYKTNFEAGTVHVALELA